MMMMGRGDLQVCSLIPEADLLTRERDREVPEGGMLSCGSSRWNVAEKEAEEAAVEIVNRLRPTRHAHQRRAQVVEYVQRLIKSSLGFEAFPYGSVPLKTFLPDGDIDLTIITTPTIEDAAVSDVHAVLRGAEQNGDSPYQVKDVHCIDAEVKLIKCIVQDIVVDISFNQLGGLCTLCFLEQVDQLVGKNHLFKRSIILIKAWCYYESRILGAHHGLISTYALETLVLYIFNLFHSSLSEPLAVLHRFLEYFGNFDWQSYCVCLNGPVCISSLPDIVVEPPENGGIKPLLSDEFLVQCVQMFSIPSTNVEGSSRAFLHKYLNIIDPLKEYNNLGRSVNRANFYRIRSAFKLGAHKLGQILLLPRGRIGSKLNEFFVNSLERNGSNHWTLMENYALVSIASNSDDTAPSQSDTISEDDVLRKPTAGQNKDRNSGALSLENSCSASYFPGENEECANRVPCGEMLQNVCTCNEISCASTPEPKESQSVNNDAVAPCSSMQSTAADTSPEKRTGDYRSFKILLDLGGDLETHYRSVVYSQYCSSYAVSATVLPAPRIFPLSQIKNAWKTVRQSLQLKWIVHSQLNSSGTMAPQYCSGKPPETVGAVNPEDKKQRGTGTYIPNMRYHSNRDGFSSGRGSNQAPGTIGRWHEQNHGNACAATSEEEIVSENGRELMLSEVEYPRLGNGKHIASDAHQSYPSMWGYSSANGFYSLPARFDSGKSGHRPEEEPLPVTMVLPDAAALCDSGSTSCPQATVITCPEQVLELEHEGVPLHSYHLKDEVDFPPLPHSKAIET